MRQRNELVVTCDFDSPKSSCAASSASAICFAIGQRFVNRDGAMRQALREILTLDQFHHQWADASAVFQPGGCARCLDD